jgi:hypothetical protein
VTQAWPGPQEIDEATLKLGDELGSGGQGRVLRVLSHPGLVYKQYKVPGADPAALKLLVDMPAQMQQDERESLYTQTSWPLARVFNKGVLSGLLMQEIPGEFSGANSAGSMKLRELQYLVYPRKPMWGDIVPVAGVSAEVRMEVVREFVTLVTTLHGKGLVIGDVSMSNVLWTDAGGGTVSIFLIDCDGIRKLGARPVLPQAETLDWNDPLQPQTGPDLDTDRYKVALLVGRVLTMSPYVRPGDPLPFVKGVPEPIAARLMELWKKTTGSYGTRLAANQWLLALSSRQEILLPPLPPKRQVPTLPRKPLDGDPTAPRPVIKLRPYGTGPVPRPPGA